MLAGSLSMSANANIASPQQRMTRLKNAVTEQMLKPVEPTYLEGSFISDGWRSNWFLGVSGGVNAFVGSPLGCEDLFGRMMPVLQIQAGKWFTPSVGSRLVYQGLRFKDSDIRSQGFGNFHMDMLWNPFAVFYKGTDKPRFDAMPYVGVGFVHNTDSKVNPFAFSYGIQGRYRVTDRFHITAELVGTTTFKNFDGIGSPTAMGDNLLSLTAGVSWTIGKVGWKRVVDPKPYIDQNERLIAYAYSLRDHNRDLTSRHNHDLRVIGELKKILKIEGLLRKHGPRIAKMESDMWNGDSKLSAFPKNDYSGLNSLMARLKGYGYDNEDLSGLFDDGNIDDAFGSSMNGNLSGLDEGKNLLADNIANETKPNGNASEVDGENTGTSNNGIGSEANNGAADFKENGGNGHIFGEGSWADYLSAISDGKECIGAPIYFFFRLGTSNLTDQSQLINLDEIARLANKYGLSIRVTGAADSATGTDKINNRLSSSRANYIADQLKQRGISSHNLKITSKGGISDHTPIEANRHTRIELYLPNL